jgi:hypothetical protein
MGLNEPQKQFRIKTLPGMNNKTEDLDLQDKWVEVAQNCRFEDEPGSVDKREPVTFFNETSTGSGGVVGLKRYYTSTGVTTFVMVHGTKAYVGNDVTGTFTEIRSNLSEGKRCSFEVYQDLLICGNGFDNLWAYDGSGDNLTWELGACKAKPVSGESGSVDAGVHYYAVTIGTGTPHVCGAVSNTITTDGTDNAVQISHIPLGPVGTVSRTLYRTTAGGSTLYKVADIAGNIETEYLDKLTDTTISGQGTYPAVNDDMPKGNILKIHRERLFITGDPTDPNKIYYSNVYLAHYIQQTTNLDYMEISPDDNDEIMGIPLQLGTMVCIKKNTIRKLNITSPTSGANPTSWSADDPIAFTGSPAQWSITQTSFGVIFLGWDHWYVFDGANVTPVMDDFDCAHILPSAYSDTVGFMQNDVFLAAYTDNTVATQFHNRIMRYNFKRKALSYDLWTSDDVAGANCFAAKSGDDETGDLYYGDSQSGYVLKAEEREREYKLRTKTDCLEGTQDDVYIGGTENAPYIEIGSSVGAQAIPENLCIFWDSKTDTPGTGWTEETSYLGRLLRLAVAYGTTAGTTTHTHTYSGDLATVNPPNKSHGETGTPGDEFSHRHTLSGTSGTGSSFPRNTYVRMFYKNSSTTEYTFPVGTLIMWDQAFAPTGWQSSDGPNGHYLRMKTGDAVDLLGVNAASHAHTASGRSGKMIGGHVASSMSTGGGTTNMRLQHDHAYNLNPGNKDMGSWELDYISFPLIKKIGAEEGTWQGEEYYAYCLYRGAGAPGNGWSIDSSYDGKYLKIGSGSVIPGDAANGSHTHSIANTTSTGCLDWGGGDDYNSNDAVHEHPITASMVSVTPSPSSVTYVLIKKVLGQMVDYNEALTSQYTSGTWTSPSQEINALTMLNMFWNETLIEGDTILIHTRSGSTQSACESESWSTGLTNPNGSVITSDALLWFQYKIELTAVDTRVSNPRVYFTDGYVIKYTYEKGNVNAELSVNFIYSLGLRNFDAAMTDKVYKRIATTHEAINGSFIVTWATELATNNFTISISKNRRYWESFMHDTANGKEINYTVSKNDLFDFRLNEIGGTYTELPQPE